MRTLLALVIACTLTVALPAGAHETDPTGPCEVPPGEAAVAVGSFYVSTLVPLLWAESNGFAGLQTHSHACTDENGRDVVFAADTHVA